MSKDKRYNKKRQPILRVEVSTADNKESVEEMEQMKDDLIKRSGNAKKGVVDMYRFAKEKGYFSTKINLTKET